MSDATDFQNALSSAPRLSARPMRPMRPDPRLSEEDNASLNALFSAERAAALAAVTALIADSLTEEGFEAAMESTSAEEDTARARAAARRALRACQREWRASASLPIVPPAMGGWVVEYIVRHQEAEEVVWGKGMTAYERVYSL